MKQSVSSRKSYLENEWSRYPIRPQNHKQAGRVVSCADGILILRSSPSDDCSFRIEACWERRLVPGDWVSLLTDADSALEVCLLAPNLTERSSSLSPSRHEVTGNQLQLIQSWTQFLGYVREYFLATGFTEVQTPTLVVCPGTEPFLDVFSTEFKQGQSRQKLYLPTSPELHLKKSMAMGVNCPFEIRPCFRNGEVSAIHQPEFWMIEWYRSFENLSVIKKDVENLVHFLIQKMNAKAKFWTPKSISVRDLFGEHCGFHLTPDTTGTDLLELAERLNLPLSSEYTNGVDFDDLFYYLFLEKIEDKLKKEGPLFVEKYPPSQAALARLTKDGWGDRFEFYWQGFEIANAFHELNDPVVQRQRLAEDLAKKAKIGKEAVPPDEDFLSCLDSGLPPSAGIALGLERLFLAIMFYEKEKPDLSQLRLFAHGLSVSKD